ncbi:hypothetical protein [Maribacter sp. 2-571]|uniref:hypothetical protein n=1 Tax=Maribacter sp. 2-571 TaxID=3417569 RepID=UPI003D32583F
MKKYCLFLLALSFTLLSGCSNNDDTDDGTPTPQNVDKTGNRLDTGVSGGDFLSNQNFTKLLIEIGYVQGFRPSDAAIDDLVSFIRAHTFKETIDVVFTELASPNEEDLTLNEIATLENDNRTAYNDEDTLATYIYFADAPSEDDDEEEGLVTLGAVYRNTSMVIHEVTARRLAARDPRISNTDVESATLNHEFGHLFGLVNLGTDPVNDHEDPSAPNHCNVEGCLMRAELQFDVSGKAILNGLKENSHKLRSACSLKGETVLKLLRNKDRKTNKAAPDLDPECVLDLENNGGR